MNVETANKLVKLRKQMGFSQEELAERIGVSRQAVSKWERSESSPDTDNLIALSRIYNISIDEMLDAEKDTSVKNNKKEEDTNSSSYSYNDVYEDTEDDNDDFRSHRIEKPLTNFPAAVPILATIVFLALGLIWDLWHPGWLVFLLIPVVMFMFPVKVNGKWSWSRNLRRIPYPVLATFIFLLLGFLFDGWAWAWLIYLTIPVWAIMYKK